MLHNQSSSWYNLSSRLAYSLQRVNSLPDMHETENWIRRLFGSAHLMHACASSQLLVGFWFWWKAYKNCKPIQFCKDSCHRGIHSYTSICYCDVVSIQKYEGKSTCGKSVYCDMEYAFPALFMLRFVSSLENILHTLQNWQGIISQKLSCHTDSSISMVYK
jgi:hypothetical protein